MMLVFYLLLGSDTEKCDNKHENNTCSSKRTISPFSQSLFPEKYNPGFIFFGNNDWTSL